MLKHNWELVSFITILQMQLSIYQIPQDMPTLMPTLTEPNLFCNILLKQNNEYLFKPNSVLQKVNVLLSRSAFFYQWRKNSLHDSYMDNILKNDI